MAYDLVRGRQDDKDWSLGASIADVGAPFLVYGAEMKKELDDLRRDVDGLNDDFTSWMKRNSSNPEARRLWDEWVKFRDQAYGVYNEWFSTASTLFTASHSPVGRRKYYDMVKDLQDQARVWRITFEKRTGEKATTPIASTPSEKKDSEGSSAWKWIAVLAGGGIGALLLARKIGA